MKKIMGGILIAAGILIAGLSGLCSLFFLFSMVGRDASILPLVLLVGGIPFAIGGGMFFGGRALLASARRDEQG